MAQYGENFRGTNVYTLCPLCSAHPDSQTLSFSCKYVQENVNLQGQYSDIFNCNVSKQLANTLVRKS